MTGGVARVRRVPFFAGGRLREKGKFLIFMNFAGVAQLVEQLIRNQQVDGSNPPASSIMTKDLAHSAKSFVVWGVPHSGTRSEVKDFGDEVFFHLCYCKQKGYQTRPKSGQEEVSNGNAPSKLRLVEKAQRPLYRVPTESLAS